ncbi:MAG: YraN family protein [Acidimicrobiia bacterium]|nr:YraN family protein [Acidimicrobiia bacterium]
MDRPDDRAALSPDREAGFTVGESEFTANRRHLGAFGERVAASFLERNGVRVLGRNIRIGKGEVDLVAADRTGRFAVEVKTGMEKAGENPRWNFTDRKARQVVRMARSLGIRRVDLVTVVVGDDGVGVEWHPRVA